MAKILIQTNLKGDAKMNKFKNSKLVQNIKENRAVYITALTLLVALAVIITLTAVANRSKKPVETDPPTVTPTETDPPKTDKPDTEVIDRLPSFSLPVSGKLSKAHDSELQVFSNTMQDYRVHLGLDICAEENSVVCAAADGTVAEIWEDDMMGQCVAITHSGDAVSVYKNLSLTLPDGLKAGTKIKAGETIGYVGDTAMTELADEPHLHFEMTVSGIQVDPMDYFGADAVATLAQDTSYESSINE